MQGDFLMAEDGVWSYRAGPGIMRRDHNPTEHSGGTPPVRKQPWNLRTCDALA
jgi:hypothetical protein